MTSPPAEALSFRLSFYRRRDHRHLLAAYADIGDLEVRWLEGSDPHANRMGSKGIGEIGIVGTARPR